ncbi:DUF433 domain-containing protein [Candidatus Bathyarchaeota archaeon]|nr:DUF433 domain-containing protein [Candidatus Bathyarchaeota archaeon]
MIEDWITVDPSVCHGKPIIRGTRIMVSNILSLLAGGYTIAQILDYYPELSQEAIKGALEYAIQVLGEEEVVLRGTS